MLIDIHAHAYRAECPAAAGGAPFATPAQVLERYDELGIGRGVLPLAGFLRASVEQGKLSQQAFARIVRGNAVRLLEL